MDAELKSRWVAALRSGEFKQGQGSLGYQNPDGLRRCCLGVLCEVARPELTLAGVDIEMRHETLVVNGNTGTMGPFASELLGLPSMQGVLPIEDFEYDAETTLTDLNDSGFTFDQIADLIEYFL